MTGSSRKLIVGCSALYLFVVAALLGIIVIKEHGQFVYGLDDPYIHLALAQNLAHGHYGIDPVEYSSPSSSVLWLFLLLPFAGSSLHVFVPLAWNLFFGTLAAGILGAIVAKWRFRLQGESPAPEGADPSAHQYLVAALLLFACNLPSLTILGMETVFQVMLAICCAYGVVEVLHHRPMPA